MDRKRERIINYLLIFLTIAYGFFVIFISTYAHTNLGEFMKRIFKIIFIKRLDFI